MKIGIVGAGISGLSIAKLLHHTFDVEILESRDVIGGIARTKTVQDTTYHTVGGHCFNSKYKDVLDFVFQKVLAKENWHKLYRNAKINFRNHDISYPIEYAIKEINNFNSDLAFQMTNDFFKSEETTTPNNLEDWFISKFGKTLADEYFIPYNKKIWNRDTKTMSPTWVEGKLPIPSKKDFYQALVSENKDTMPHSSFYYPNSNNQNSFIEALGQDINVILNYPVKKIEKKEEKWIINDEKEYDLIINTSPLNSFAPSIVNAPNKIIEYAQKLKFNQVSNVIWKPQNVDFSWLYIPSPDIKIHRVINIGSFFNPKSNHVITEIIGNIDYATIKKEGEKLNFLIEPLDYHVSTHAYVVFDQNTQICKEEIFKYLNEVGLYTLGRFGEWDYYNMDICIKKAIDLSNKLIKLYTR